MATILKIWVIIQFLMVAGKLLSVWEVATAFDAPWFNVFGPTWFLIPVLIVWGIIKFKKRNDPEEYEIIDEDDED